VYVLIFHRLEAASAPFEETMKKKAKRRKTFAIPVERYTPERKAEFLLTNAIDLSDYRRARKQVRRLGLDPDTIPHLPPQGHPERSEGSQTSAGRKRVRRIAEAPRRL
jgi:hypothetical protein